MMGPQRLLVIADSPILRKRFESLVEERDLTSRVRRLDIRTSDPGAGIPAVDVAAEAGAIQRDFDVLLSLHCRQLIPPALVASLRCINLHPGLNPHNRGWFPHVFGLIRGLPVGATLHVMSNRIDDGPIIGRVEVETFPWDDSATLYERVLQAEIRLLEAHLDEILTGEYHAVHDAAVARPNTKEDFRRICELDLHETTTVGDVLTRLRALSHPPFWNAFFRAGGEKVFVRLALKRDTDPE
jgi:dTDP-4-amino-4,6-dideoxyglucose formyltransferase